MKRWCALVFPFLVGASCLCGYASPQDRQYVDYFLHLQAADLFRTQSFVLNWSCAYLNVNNRLQGVDFSFSCYRSLSLNAARKLLVSIAEDLVNRINKDPSIQERHLLPEPFNLNQLYLKIETENVFSAQADPETIRVMILDRGNITYETYRGSTLFYGRTLEYHETLEMARMLLGEVPAFDEKPMPPQVVGFKATVEQSAPETPPQLPGQAVEAPQLEQLPPEHPLKGAKAASYTKEVLPSTAFPEPGPEVPLSESSSLNWKEATQGLQQVQATGSTLPAPAQNAPEEGSPQPTGMAGEEEIEEPQSHPNMPVESSEAPKDTSETLPLNTLETQDAVHDPEPSEQLRAKPSWSDDQGEVPNEGKNYLPEPTENEVPDAPLRAVEQEPSSTQVDTSLVPESNIKAMDIDHPLSVSSEQESEETLPSSEEPSSFLAWVAKKLDSPSVPEETGHTQSPELLPVVSEEIAETAPEEQESSDSSEESSSFLAWVAKKLDSPSVPEETGHTQSPELLPVVSEKIAEIAPEEQGSSDISEEPSSFLAWVAKKLDSPSVPEEAAHTQSPELLPTASEEIAEIAPEEQGSSDSSEEPSSFLAWVAKKLDSPSVPEETGHTQSPELLPVVSEEIAEIAPEKQVDSDGPEELLSSPTLVAEGLDSYSASEEASNVQNPEQPVVVSDEITKSVPEDQETKEGQANSEASSSILDWITSKFGAQTEDRTPANEGPEDSERLEESLPSVTGESLQSESQSAVGEESVTEESVQSQEEPGDDPSQIIMHPPHEVLEPMPIEAPEPQTSFMDRWFGWMKSSSTEEAVRPEEPSKDASQPDSQEPLEVPHVESLQPQQDPTMAVTNETPEPQTSFVDRWFGWTKTSSTAEVVQSEEEPSEDASQPSSQEPSEVPHVESLQPQQDSTMAVTNETPEPQSSFMDRWFGWMKSSSKEEPTETEPSQPVLENVDTDAQENPSSTKDQQDKSLGDRILGWFRSTPEGADESKILADVYEPAPLPPVIHDETQNSSDENGDEDSASQETRPWYSRLGSIFSSSTDSAIVQNQEDTVIAEESVEDSDEEALAWVERFGSWSREKLSESQVQEQPAPITVTASENLQPKSVEQPQVQALGNEKQAGPEKDVVYEDPKNLIADRLGDVSRPDEVWKDLDQDDYCPDDDEDVDEDLDEDIQQGSFSPFLSTRQPTKTRSGSSYFRPAE